MGCVRTDVYASRWSGKQTGRPKATRRPRQVQSGADAADIKGEPDELFDRGEANRLARRTARRRDQPPRLPARPRPAGRPLSRRGAPGGLAAARPAAQDHPAAQAVPAGGPGLAVAAAPLRPDGVARRGRRGAAAQRPGRVDRAQPSLGVRVPARRCDDALPARHVPPPRADRDPRRPRAGRGRRVGRGDAHPRLRGLRARRGRHRTGARARLAADAPAARGRPRRARDHAAHRPLPRRGGQAHAHHRRRLRRLRDRAPARGAPRVRAAADRLPRRRPAGRRGRPAAPGPAARHPGGGLPGRRQDRRRARHLRVQLRARPRPAPAGAPLRGARPRGLARPALLRVDHRPRRARWTRRAGSSGSSTRSTARSR